MANTYTQIIIHVIFAVEYRQCLILPEWKDELYKYITGIVQNNGHKLLIINGVQNHIHALVGMKPIQSISELMQQIKGDSSRWINKNGFVRGKFNWQAGFGAFSHSMSQLPKVISYIKNQELHHSKLPFRDEYKRLLDNFCVEYDEKYLLKDIC